MSESKLTLEQLIAAIEQFEPEELSLLEEHLKQRQSELHLSGIEENPSGTEVSVPEDFPLRIQELLKKKGWNWPPDKKLKAQICEAGKRLSGSIHIEPDILQEVRKDDFPSRFPDNRVGKLEPQNEAKNGS